jgi:hypothetical protein
VTFLIIPPKDGIAQEVVTNECEWTSLSLILKLFLEHLVMTTFLVVYPQLWVKNLITKEETFHIHLNVLKWTFCALRKVGDNGKIVLTLLSIHNLDLQTFFFKTTMVHNYEVVLDEDNELNLVIKI